MPIYFNDKGDATIIVNVEKWNSNTWKFENKKMEISIDNLVEKCEQVEIKVWEQKYMLEEPDFSIKEWLQDRDMDPSGDDRR